MKAGWIWFLAAGLPGLAACDAVMPPPPAAAPVAQGPLYCYTTLGKPDCYAEPQAGPPNRLVGMIAPALPPIPAPAAVAPLPPQGSVQVQAPVLVNDPGRMNPANPPPAAAPVAPVQVQPLPLPGATAGSAAAAGGAPVSLRAMP